MVERVESGIDLRREGHEMCFIGVVDFLEFFEEFLVVKEGVEGFIFAFTEAFFSGQFDDFAPSLFREPGGIFGPFGEFFDHSRSSREQESHVRFVEQASELEQSHC